MDDAAGTDEALARRLRERDATALAVLYARYGDVVYGLAARMVGDEAAAEITQEVFLTLWHKADGYDPARGRFRAWLLRIAHHRAIDELRRRRAAGIQVSGESALTILGDLPDPTPDPEEQTWQGQRAALVGRALATLPPEQRQVVDLAYFGGLSREEIATRQQVPAETVKKRLRLALAKLRASLDTLSVQEPVP